MTEFNALWNLTRAHGIACALNKNFHICSKHLHIEGFREGERLEGIAFYYYQRKERLQDFLKVEFSGILSALLFDFKAPETHSVHMILYMYFLRGLSLGPFL